MSAMIVTVFVASVAGSLHCAGMCGAFMLFAIGASEGKQAGSWRLHAAYHLGRLATYLVFGVIAGLVGAVVELGGGLVGIQYGAAIAAAGFMIVTGAIMLTRSRGVRLPHMPVPGSWRRLASRGYKLIATQRPGIRAIGTGLLTTLLPCGWLYMFVVAAAGTGHPAKAAATMAVFWLGTLPVLVALGTGVRALLGPMAKRAPVIAALALIVVGVITICNRIVLIERTPGMFEEISRGPIPVSSEGTVTPPCCHEGS